MAKLPSLFSSSTARPVHKSVDEDEPRSTSRKPDGGAEPETRRAKVQDKPTLRTVQYGQLISAVLLFNRASEPENILLNLVHRQMEKETKRAAADKQSIRNKRSEIVQKIHEAVRKRSGFGSSLTLFFPKTQVNFTAPERDEIQKFLLDSNLMLPEGISIKDLANVLGVGKIFALGKGKEVKETMNLRLTVACFLALEKQGLQNKQVGAVATDYTAIWKKLEYLTPVDSANLLELGERFPFLAEVFTADKIDYIKHTLGQ